MKTHKWIVNVDGTENEVVFVPHFWRGKHELTVNGEKVEVKKTPFQMVSGLDWPITIRGKECRLVAVPGAADIAVDGVYLNSKKEYRPLKTNWWLLVFIIGINSCLFVPPSVASWVLLAMGIFFLLVMIFRYSFFKRFINYLKDTGNRAWFNLACIVLFSIYLILERIFDIKPVVSIVVFTIYGIVLIFDSIVACLNRRERKRKEQGQSSEE